MKRLLIIAAATVISMNTASAQFDIHSHMIPDSYLQAVKALHPGRFLFCAALPLPDVGRALEEAKYALEILGADGVKLATNSYGQYLGDPELEPLMAYLNSRKAVIITHPHKPSAVNGQLIAAVPLQGLYPGGLCRPKRL